MKRKIDLTGQRFGKLVAKSCFQTETSGGYKILKWNCECDCGNTTTVRSLGRYDDFNKAVQVRKEAEKNILVNILMIIRWNMLRQ